MGSIFYAVPSVPQSPPPTAWPGVDMQWTGTDGTVWPLTDPGSGVRLLAGTRGLTTPPRSRFTSTSAGVPGARNRGGRTGEREVFWPVSLHHGGGTLAWLEYDAAFWASLNPRGTGVWRVAGPDGSVRELTCRPAGDSDKAWSDSPGGRYWTHYGIYLIAEDPFWYGPEVRSPLWTSGAPVDFIPAAGGPPYHPGSATTIDTASLTNPGDEDAWPTWTVTGPVDSIAVAVDGHTVGYGPLVEGQVLIIDTDPRVQRALLDGTDVTGNLTSFDFAPVRAGETAQLDITMTGGGTLQAAFSPRYDRAW